MLDFLLPIIFVLFAAFVIWSFLSKSGRGRMLGGEIDGDIKEVVAKKTGMSKTSISVAKISTKDGTNKIGIEIRQKATLAFSSTPITLSPTEAKLLAQHILEASDED